LLMSLSISDPTSSALCDPERSTPRFPLRARRARAAKNLLLSILVDARALCQLRLWSEL
jgi:hypothetical protein